MAYTFAPAAHPRPEVELLLCCARTCMDAERAEHIKALLRKEIEWSYLLRIADLHGVMPLLYRSLHTICPDTVPQAMLERLRKYFHANALRNRMLTEELLKLLHLFEEHEISAIPYKGPALAVSAYGNLTLRRFYDLDILVHKHNLLRVKHLLVSQGYHLPLTSIQEAYFYRHRYHYAFVREDDKVRAYVEIHWAFTRRSWSFPCDPEHLWKRLEPVSLAGRTVFTFHPEDLLLLLCVHGAKDYWRRLLWICDIAELLRLHQAIEWERVVHQASKWGSRRMLFLGLFLARDLLGAALPEEILQKIQIDPVIASLGRRVRERLFSETPSGFGDVEYLRLRERFRDWVPYILYRVPSYLSPNAKDQALLPLPTPLFFLVLPPSAHTTDSSIWVKTLEMVVSELVQRKSDG